MKNRVGKKWILVGVFLLCTLSTEAQIRVSGTIKEQGSEEVLSFVKVSSQDGRHATMSNSYGFFSLLLPDADTICFSHVGFMDTCMYAGRSQSLSILLAQVTGQLSLDTVQIAARSSNDQLNLSPGHLIIPVSQLASIPTLAGQPDALKGLQLLPGVQFGLEGTTGLFIRGGTPDQNLILLDEMPVYNVSHLFGFFSLFPPDALQSVELYRGGFPARYGGRVSSVIKLQTRDGTVDGWKRKLSLGIISSGFTLEGPIIKNKTSLFVTARRSLVDIISQPLSRISLANQGVNGSFGYYFYDAIGKITHRFSNTDRLYFSIYTGRDQNKVSLSTQAPNEGTSKTLGILYWGNITSSLRYNKVYSPVLFSNSIVGYTQYRYNSNLENEGVSPSGDPYLSRLTQSSFIRDWTAKHTFEYYPSNHHHLTAGIDVSFQQFTPDIQVVQSLFGAFQTDTSFNDLRYNNQFFSLFGEHKWKVHPQLMVDWGIRVDKFFLGDFSDWSVQPRVNTVWNITTDCAIKGSFSTVQQYLHLLSSSGLALPADLWAPATASTPQVNSYQTSLAFSYSLPNGILLSIESYYKKMNNVVAYRDGTSYFGRFENWEEKVSSGIGDSYGVEFFLHKPVGKMNGWLSYTLSKSTRTFPDINQGEPFPFRFDRRHNLSLVLNYQLSKPGRELSLSWMYVSGAKITVPSQRFNTVFDINQLIGGTATNPITLQTTNVFAQSAFWAESRNNASMRPFHKLDIAYRVSPEKKKRPQSWSLGMYNLYGNRNPLYVFFDSRPERDVQNNPIDFSGKLVEYSLLMWIPSFGYEVEF